MTMRLGHAVNEGGDPIRLVAWTQPSTDAA